MVVKDAPYSLKSPWFIQLRQLLREMQDNQDSLAMQKVIVNNIFYTISQNITHIKLVPQFVNAICQKLIDWQYSRQPVERNIFQQYSFLLDVLKPFEKINPK
jgi:hypothetical protein